MNRVLKSAKVMKVIFLVLMICCLTVGINPPSVSSTKSLSQQVEQSGPLSLSNSNQNKDETSLTEVHDGDSGTLPIRKKDDKKSSVSCITESCNGTDEKSKVPSSASSQDVSSQDHDGSKDLRRLNPEALMRAFYVFAGLSVIVMVYIAWKR